MYDTGGTALNWLSQSVEEDKKPEVQDASDQETK